MDSIAKRKFRISFNNDLDLTEGGIVSGLLAFAIPLFLGQLLQQLYSLADAWIVSRFVGQEALGAVSTTGSITFFVVGFFNGISIGGSVIISKYYGAKMQEKVTEAIHANVLFAIISSIGATVIGMIMVHPIIYLMRTPAATARYEIPYLMTYFAGVSTIIFYNIGMSIMRALGDSTRPLIYLVVSSVINVILDFVFVGVFGWGVVGAGVATVIAQAVSAVLCFIKMAQRKDYTRLTFKQIKWNPEMMREIIVQGVPTGIQNSVISIGNMVVQSNINAFGDVAMAGVGAYFKIEGFVFLPTTAMSMALPTFISQNLGAKQYDRAKKGAVVGIISGALVAELIGIIMYITVPQLLTIFIQESDKVDPQQVADAIAYGVKHARITSVFFCLLAYSHCAAGVLRGCGKAIVPMVTMLTFWCAVRVTYVTLITHFIPDTYQVVAWAYPLTWTCSTIVFTLFLIFSDWTHNFERRENSR